MPTSAAIVSAAPTAYSDFVPTAAAVSATVIVVMATAAAIMAMRSLVVTRRTGPSQKHHADIARSASYVSSLLYPHNSSTFPRLCTPHVRYTNSISNKLMSVPRYASGRPIHGFAVKRQPILKPGLHTTSGRLTRAMASKANGKTIFREAHSSEEAGAPTTGELELPSGLCPVYKPRGWTSADVTNKIKATLEIARRKHDAAVASAARSDGNAVLDNETAKGSTKGKSRGRRSGKPRIKVGHGGTLDPEATGVLVVGIGKGCGMMQGYLEGGKAYLATGRLGTATDTLDFTGKVTEQSDWHHVTPEKIEEVLPAFRGEIQQVPPMYSALRRGGKKLYELAREGVEVEREARTVRVDKLDLVTGTTGAGSDVGSDKHGQQDFALAIECGGGTYVRSLIADIAQSCGTVAHMTELERTRQGPFELSDCLSPDEFGDFQAIKDHTERSTASVLGRQAQFGDDATGDKGGASPSDSETIGKVYVTGFCRRQFEDATHSGFLGDATTVAEVEAHLNNLIDSGKVSLSDGYAPFCKHFFIDNVLASNLRCTTAKITESNAHMLRSGYSARTSKELPVLTRWFPAECGLKAEEATVLDVILYSVDQIKKERAAMRGEGSNEDIDDEPGMEGCSWGVVSIKAQNVHHELPMQPITMMRNALGREEGGSGVALDPQKYSESVAYWSEHAPIQDQ